MRSLGTLCIAVTWSLLAAGVARADGPPPVGDLAFVEMSALFQGRLGLTYSVADLHGDRPVHAEAARLHAGMEIWITPPIDRQSGLGVLLGAELSGGPSIPSLLGPATPANALWLDGFPIDLDTTVGAAWRQFITYETVWSLALGYRWALNTMLIRGSDNLEARMWHLGYARAGFRVGVFEIEGGVGFGVGGLHAHGGPRVWVFDDAWLGAEVVAWMTPGDRDLFEGRLFFEVRGGE